MTTWLQKRLAVWMGASLLGGVLVWSVGASQAQEDDAKGRRGLTRDEVATAFSYLMNDLSSNRSGAFVGNISLYELTSLKNKQDLGDGHEALREAMAAQWKRPQPKVKVQSQSDRTATVVVENLLPPQSRPLVLVKDVDGWGVDMVATYAQWNNLEGVAKAKAIYKLTGAMIDEYPRTEQMKRQQCLSNLKQIALGIRHYTMDYDKKLPLAKPPKPWVDTFQPYLKSETIFNCPSLPQNNRYGYAYNSVLSNKLEAFPSKRPNTVLIYETSVLERRGIGENRAFRHENGANYAFADGHVKWFAKTQIPSFELKPLKNRR